MRIRPTGLPMPAPAARARAPLALDRVELRATRQLERTTARTPSRVVLQSLGQLSLAVGTGAVPSPVLRAVLQAARQASPSVAPALAGQLQAWHQNDQWSGPQAGQVIGSRVYAPAPQHAPPTELARTLHFNSLHQIDLEPCGRAELETHREALSHLARGKTQAGYNHAIIASHQRLLCEFPELATRAFLHEELEPVVGAYEAAPEAMALVVAAYGPGQALDTALEAVERGQRFRREIFTPIRDEQVYAGFHPSPTQIDRLSRQLEVELANPQFDGQRGHFGVQADLLASCRPDSLPLARRQALLTAMLANPRREPMVQAVLEHPSLAALITDRPELRRKLTRELSSPVAEALLLGCQPTVPARHPGVAREQRKLELARQLACLEPQEVGRRWSELSAGVEPGEARRIALARWLQEVELAPELGKAARDPEAAEQVFQALAPGVERGHLQARASELELMLQAVHRGRVGPEPVQDALRLLSLAHQHELPVAELAERYGLARDRLGGASSGQLSELLGLLSPGDFDSELESFQSLAGQVGEDAFELVRRLRPRAGMSAVAELASVCGEQSLAAARELEPSLAASEHPRQLLADFALVGRSCGDTRRALAVFGEASRCLAERPESRLDAGPLLESLAGLDLPEADFLRAARGGLAELARGGSRQQALRFAMQECLGLPVAPESSQAIGREGDRLRVGGASLKIRSRR